jgi:hypothetical protein
MSGYTHAMTKTKTPGGYEYKGVAITRKSSSYWGRKRNKARRNAMGMVHTTVWAVEGAPSFTRLRDAIAFIDQTQTQKEAHHAW